MFNLPDKGFILTLLALTVAACIGLGYGLGVWMR